MRLSLILVGLLCPSLLLLCCQHKTAVSHALPGWVETTSSGVSISLPPAIKVFDVSSGDMEEIRKRIKTQYANEPQLLKAVTQLASSDSMKLVAMPPNNSSGKYQGSFNLVVLPVTAKTTTVDMVEANRVQMKAVAVAGTLNVELRNYPAGQAAFFQFDIISGSVPHTQTTYIFVHESKEYVFTFSCEVPEKRNWSEVADSAIQTVHFPE